MSAGFLSRLVGAKHAPQDASDGAGAGPAYPVRKSEAEWKADLSPEQFQVLRKHGTERPFTHPLNDEKRVGRFHCAGCGAPLFDSATKFESGSGWPSFYEPLDGAVGTSVDHVLLSPRTEVHCAQCGGHLGHVFEDGPAPTGQRYCMNGTAMAFDPADGEASGRG
ncbi:peptide-methionine (R)-S-oxide reductase MsrB [Roseospira navarrensis]|uniref:peptide-methionine (R)-S-oxide reductase n=1 Tax=Roseospira navarrensis TaxID=140058 RepID=A0A7X1ZDX9_9PROT|nr:peptide-methionine (R)-S-oxide reductase MsrB [Roseospira navarrensis]MQX36770.1 peptide-methionine (R)-S-oxide reductase MsrB [Roseospira navarrensis]